MKQIKRKEISAALRRQVMERDNGICAECFLDTIYLKARLTTCRFQFISTYELTINDYPWVRDRLHKEFGTGKRDLPLFEIDHHLPVAEGGKNELDNLRTLCWPCHVKATRWQAQRKKKVAKEKERRRTSKWSKRGTKKRWLK